MGLSIFNKIIHLLTIQHIVIVFNFFKESTEKFCSYKEVNGNERYFVSNHTIFKIPSELFVEKSRTDLASKMFLMI